MHGWEIHTALRHHAPIIVVIGNDQGWGMERELQAAFYGRTIGTELGLVRYDRVVETLGGYGEYVELPSELGPALDRAFKAGRPACINVLMRGVASALTKANIERYKS
jgi:acetolactate synthase-1/2/3 large subunit